MQPAKFYSELNSDWVKCQLCQHYCQIKPGSHGRCRVRVNRSGQLYTLNYGKVITQSTDPIEKKPLYHFLPNTQTYSLACAGCNFTCRYCQNADISQFTTSLAQFNATLPEIPAQDIVDLALVNDCPSIAYTYTEPTVYLEYAWECMQLAHQSNLKNVWVSNGYMSDLALQAILPYLDAINVDLKFFRDKTYLNMTGAHLQPVLETLMRLKENDIHTEITTLIIPGINDSVAEMTDIAKFIFQKLGQSTPWHVSAFYPTYQLHNLPPTDPETVLRAQQIGRQIGLRHVYIGNV